MKRNTGKLDSFLMVVLTVAGFQFAHAQEFPSSQSRWSSR